MKLKLLIFILVILNLIPLVSSQYYYDQGFNFPSIFPFFDFSFGNFSDFYQQNHSWLDFFIVLALFFVASKSALEERLGNAAPAVTALILAIGFASLERTFDFNLGYFGPIAVLIFILWFFHLIFKKFGEHRNASITSFVVFAIISLIALYFFFKPNFSGFISSRPYTSSGIAIGVLLLIILGLYFLFRTSPNENQTRGIPETPSIPQAVIPSPNLRKDYKNVEKLVNDFLKLVKDKTIREELIDDRYNATNGIMDHFLVNTQDPKYRGYAHELRKNLNTAYSSYKGSADIEKQADEQITRLNSLIQFINKYKLADQKIFFEQELEFYKKVTNKSAKHQIIRNLLNKLSLKVENIEEKAEQQIVFLNNLLSNIDKFKPEDLKSFLENQIELFNGFTNRSSKSAELHDLINKLRFKLEKEHPILDKVNTWFYKKELDRITEKILELENEINTNSINKKEANLKIAELIERLKNLNLSKDTPKDKINELLIKLNTLSGILNKEAAEKKENINELYLKKEIINQINKINYVIKNIEKYNFDEINSINKEALEIYEKYKTTKVPEINHLVKQLISSLTILVNKYKKERDKIEKTKTQGINELDEKLKKTIEIINYLLDNIKNYKIEELVGYSEPAHELYIEYQTSSPKNQKLLKEFYEDLAALDANINKLKINSEKKTPQKLQPTDKAYRDRELYELRSSLSRAIEKADNIPAERLSNLLKEATTIFSKYYDLDSYFPDRELLVQLKNKIQKLNKIASVDKEDKERALYQVRDRLKRAIKNSDKISVENLSQVLNWSENIFDQYTGSYRIEPESSLIYQLRAILEKKKRTKINPAETDKEEELYRLRQTLSKASSNDVSVENLEKTLIYATKILDKYYNSYYPLDESELMEKIKTLIQIKKLLNEQIEILTKIIQKINEKGWENLEATFRQKAVGSLNYAERVFDNYKNLNTTLIPELNKQLKELERKMTPIR